MMWRERVQRIAPDYILTVGSLIFILGMLKTVFDPSAHVPLLTSLPTACALACFTWVQWSVFKARFGAVANGITACLWFLVAALRQ